MLTPTEYYASFGENVAQAHAEFTKDISHFFKMFAKNKPSPKILVIGDLIVDAYQYVKLEPRVERKSTTPVYTSYAKTEALGGAFNHARLFAALGCSTTLICPTADAPLTTSWSDRWGHLLQQAEDRYALRMPEVYFSQGYYETPHQKTRTLQVVSKPELAVDDLSIEPLARLRQLESSAYVRPLHRVDAIPQLCDIDERPKDVEPSLLGYVRHRSQSDKNWQGHYEFTRWTWESLLEKMLSDGLPDAIVYVIDGSEFCLSAYSCIDAILQDDPRLANAYRKIPVFIAYNDSLVAQTCLESILRLASSQSTGCNLRGFFGPSNCHSPRLQENVEKAIAENSYAPAFAGIFLTNGEQPTRAVVFFDRKRQSIRNLLPVPTTLRRQTDLKNERLVAAKWHAGNDQTRDFSGSGDFYAASMIQQLLLLTELPETTDEFSLALEQLHRASSDIAVNLSFQMPGALTQPAFPESAVHQCLDRFSDNLLFLGLGGSIFVDADTLKKTQAVLAEGHEKTYGFVNGCFDAAHPGHFDFVRRVVADFNDNYTYPDMQTLVFALNSDHSIRTLKGEQRPYLFERERIYQLSVFLTAIEAQNNTEGLSLKLIVLFDEPTTEVLLQQLRCAGSACINIYKGKAAESDAERKALMNECNSVGANLQIFKNGFFEDISTTSIYGTERNARQ